MVRRTKSKWPSRSVSTYSVTGLEKCDRQPDEYQIPKVEIDELRMAHTRVRQTVGSIPVWEGEAIVHLKSDGSFQRSRTS